MGAAESSSKLASYVHDFIVKDVRGNDVEHSRCKGKVLLIVNVASRCGLTNSNHTGLGSLHKKYGDKGGEDSISSQIVHPSSNWASIILNSRPERVLIWQEQIVLTDFRPTACSASFR